MAYQPNSYKKFVATAATATLVASAIVPVALANEATVAFTDVSAKYKDAVDYLVSENLSNGLTETEFGINANIKRGDAAIILAKALGIQDDAEAADSGFSDVPTRASLAINSLKAAGVIKGKTATRFGFEDNLTRGEVALILANVKAYNYSGDVSKLKFTDVIGTRYASAVAGMVEAGITQGKTATSFGTSDAIKRGDFAIFIYKAEGSPALKANVDTLEINAEGNEFTLMFNRMIPADADIKWLADNYSITINGDAATEAQLTALKLEVKSLSADGKTLVVSHTDFDELKLTGTSVELAIGGAKDTYTFAVVVAPKVESVMAINGIQLEVKFNKAVDVATAENVNNYDISNVTGSAVGANPASAEVQADGKTVVLTLAAAATTKTTFSVAVSDVNLEGSAVNEFPLYTQVVTVDDSTNPVVDSVVSRTNSNVAQSATVYFSEPVTGGAIKIDGTTVPYVLSADGLSASISGLNLDANANHTVQVINLTDAAGNINDSATKTFAVTKDVVSPTFNVSTQSDEKIILTFDKAIDPSTVSAGSIVLKDEALDTVAGYSVTVPAGYGNKRVEITLPAGTYTSKATRSFTILASDAVKDSLGNKLVATQKTVSISKDVVAPVLNNVEYVKDSSGEVQFVVFNFNEKVEETAVYGLTAKNTVTGANVDLFGTVTAGTVEVQANGTSVRVAAAGAAVITNGKLEIATPTGFVKDTALTGNDSAATKTVVDFGAGSSTALKVSTVTNPTRNQYVVTFDGTVTYASASNPANYTINGVALPANTTIAYDTTNLNNVTITLPAGFVSSDDTGAVLRVQNVETSSGTKVSANTNVVTVDDNTAPLFAATKSAINTNGTFSLGFNESVSAVTAGNLGDLVFNVNGTNVLVGNGNVAIADGTGSDAGKYVFTFTTDIATGTETDGTPNYTEYFDVDGDNTLDPTDIIVTAKTTAVLAAKTLNLNTLSGFKVSTIATPTSIADTNAPTANLIKGSQALQVK